MTTNTDTIPVEKDTATRETPRPSKSRPRFSLRAILAWGAIGAACIAVAALAVATFTGGDDKVKIPATPRDPMADRYEWQAHLEGQARTHGGDGKVDIPATPRDPMADRYEWQAHLEGQARTHGGDHGSDNQAESNSTDSDPDDAASLPGSPNVPAS